MAGPLVVPTTFGPLSGPVALSLLDGNFGYLASQVFDSIAALRLSTPKTVAAQAGRMFATGWYGPGDGGGGPYYYDPTDTTSLDNGGSIIVAADGSRIKLIIIDYVTILQFGAKPTTTFDSTAAIQAAVNTGLFVRAPAGSYKVTSPITLVSGGGLYGDGEATSFVRFFSGGQLFRYPGGTQYKTPIILRDFSITTDVSVTVVSGDTGIDIGYQSAWSGRGLVSNILILNQWDGFKWTSGADNTFVNIQVWYGKGHGFYGINARGELTDCLAQFNAGNGYFFYASSVGETGVQLTSCGTFANQGWGFLFDGAVGVGSANIFMKGCQSSTDGTGGIGFVKPYSQVFMDEVFIESAGTVHAAYAPFVNSTTAIGLYITNGCQLVNISNLFIQTSNGGGAYFDTVGRLNLSDAIIINNGNGLAGGANQVGVNFNTNCTDVEVTNLIANYGANQITDLAISSAGNAIDFVNTNFRTYYNPNGGSSARFGGLVKTTASSSVASASTTVLPDYIDFITITGTTNINAITASWAGRRVALKFAGILTVANGNNLFLTAVYTTAADSVLCLRCDGTNWYEESRASNR